MLRPRRQPVLLTDTERTEDSIENIVDFYDSYQRFEGVGSCAKVHRGDRSGHEFHAASLLEGIELIAGGAHCADVTLAGE